MMKLNRSLSTVGFTFVSLYFAISVIAAPVADDSSPADLWERETACIALGTCPGMNPPHSPSPSSNPPPPPTSTPPSSTPSATPTSTTPSSPKITTESIDPYIYKCDDGQKKLIKEAWNEAKTLSEAHYKWDPPGFFSGGAYQPAMSFYFFGDGPLKRNIRRQYAIHHSTDNHPWAYMYIYCNEDDVPEKPNKPKKPQCNNPSNPKRVVAAYTFDDLGTIWWNAHYVVLCPQWFNTTRLTSLSQKTEDAKKDPSIHQYMDPWRAIRARSMFHETYHWENTISQPKCAGDLAYSPQDVVNLAKNSGTDKAKVNAESWAQAAMAIYLQQTFNINDPPGPNPNPSFDADSIEDNELDGVPDWFQTPYPDGSIRQAGSGNGPSPVPDGSSGYEKLGS